MDRALAEEADPSKGIDVGMDEVGVDDVEWALSDSVEDSMSQMSYFGCIHWDRNMIGAVACHWGLVWLGTLRLNSHFRWERPQGLLFHVDDLDHWEDGDYVIGCVGLNWIAKGE